MVTDLGIFKKDIELLQSGRHTNPHRILGLHSLENGQKEIRFWAPNKKHLNFYYKGESKRANLIDSSGLFTFLVPPSTTFEDYRLIYPNGLVAHDPYTFASTFSKVDSVRFIKGIHYEIYDSLGSHIAECEGVKGVKFAVWAPNAKRVSIVSEFNHWKEFTFPMRKIEESGVWEIFIPGLDEGIKYKYAILSKNGKSNWKSDPYSHQFELRPQTASVVSSSTHFPWRDSEWMQERIRKSALDGPMNIYEMHLGSWQKKKGGHFNYRELAAEIVPYLKDMGYTHLEIMPITEHPLDESWGYQVTGYFAPTSRFGTLEDFQYFVNHLHMHHIGVILDWAPGHFPSDDFSLTKFDGEALYEKNHDIMGWHPEWKTHIFDYANLQVTNFLIASALFWLEKMHIDGIRVDAVESMLYLDYARKDGEWIANQNGGNENLEAIEFLKHLNSIVHQKIPGILMIAEDSSLFEGVTRPLEWGGLGFDLKWNLGWMNDTLQFMQRDPIYRKYHMPELLLGFDEVFRERYILPISHDEVVHGKKSLHQKMPLDEWHKFAQMRLYYSAALCHPGKNLFFMGLELGQKTEWDCKDEIHWDLLKSHMHIKWKKFVRAMNKFYLKHNSLWEIDFDKKGFAWIANNDYNHSVISYLRKGIDSHLVCVHNYTPTEFDEYVIPLANVKSVNELFNSDEPMYGGTERKKVKHQAICNQTGFAIQMPPLATLIFEVTFEQESNESDS